MRERILGLVALFGAMTIAGAAVGQTAAQPMRSSIQIVAGSASDEPFLVDVGAERVVVDVRQLTPDERCTILAPSGLPVEMTKAVEYESVGEDLSGSGDPLGNYQDMVAWDLPEAGEHVVAVSDEFVALVRIEGGAELAFWFEGTRPDGSIGEEQPFQLWATMHDASGAPLNGATVTVDIRQTGKVGTSKLPGTIFTQSVTLAPVRDGTYSATIAVPKKGTFHVSVLGEHGLVRRQLATSFAVWTGAPPAMRGGASPPPITLAAFAGATTAGADKVSAGTSPATTVECSQA